MRRNLTTKHFTKAERIVGEILKRNRIPFNARVNIEGREIDFIVGKYAIEINGHEQSSDRNSWLQSLGYTPMHFSNREVVLNPTTIETIITQCQ